MEKKFLQAQKRLKAMKQEFKAGDKVSISVIRLGGIKKVLTGTVTFSGTHFLTVRSEKSGSYSYMYIDMLLGDVIVQKEKLIA